mmetsp:Transcript_68558/g.142960  ORF Transcript_68558/g.142960 Transcript_68558/m.142960 type:complete len:399 (+) Transcript_68558:985-2181(+)
MSAPKASSSCCCVSSSSTAHAATSCIGCCSALTPLTIAPTSAPSGACPRFSPHSPSAAGRVPVTPGLPGPGPQLESPPPRTMESSEVMREVRPWPRAPMTRTLGILEETGARILSMVVWRDSRMRGSLPSACKLITSCRCLSANIFTGVRSCGVRRSFIDRGRMSLGSIRHRLTLVPGAPWIVFFQPRSTASEPVRSVPSAEMTMSPRRTSPDASAELSGATSDTRKNPAPDPTSTITEMPTSPMMVSCCSSIRDGIMSPSPLSRLLSSFQSLARIDTTCPDDSLKGLCSLVLVALLDSQYESPSSNASACNMGMKTSLLEGDIAPSLEEVFSSHTRLKEGSAPTTGWGVSSSPIRSNWSFTQFGSADACPDNSCSSGSACKESPESPSNSISKSLIC